MPATVVQLKPPDAPPACIEGLFREHKAMIFRAAYRITGSASEAEDVLQTIFLRLMQSDNELPDRSTEKHTAAYMHRAAINCALDVVRKRRHAPSLSLEDAPQNFINTQTPDPEAAFEERELRCLLQAAVARLHPKSAEAFVLRYFEGKSNREIGELLQTSPLVIAVMLHRARTRLRDDIGDFLERHHETKH